MPDTHTSPRQIDVRMLSVRALSPNPDNPRRQMDETALKELAASIAAHGILQPITVRRNPRNEMPAWDIVTGHRRVAAFKLAFPDSPDAPVPCIVRELDDKQVLELQITENLQREDVHPLDEADGYRRLMDEHGYTADAIAAAVGKSRRYVFNTLKLRSLAAAVRDAMFRGEISRSHGLEIAKLCSFSQQETALARAVKNELSVSELRAHIEREYMQPLADAEFSLDDADLLPEAGACAACPKRTINQPELFGTGADLCTDGGCFRTKRSVHIVRRRQRVQEQAEREGVEIFSGEAAEKMFRFFAGEAPRPRPKCGWLVLDDVTDIEYAVADAEDPIPTWRATLQTEDVEEKVKSHAYVQAPDGRDGTPGKVWELAKCEEIERALAPLKRRLAQDEERREVEASAAARAAQAPAKALTAADRKRLAAEARRRVEGEREELLIERVCAALHAATAAGQHGDDVYLLAAFAMPEYALCRGMAEAYEARWGFSPGWHREPNLQALRQLSPTDAARAALEAICACELMSEMDEEEDGATALGAEVRGLFARHRIDLQAVRRQIEIELPLPTEAE